MERDETPRGVIGGQVMRFQRVTSTMDVAWQLVEAEAPHGMAVVAQVQTAGRGRFLRRWISGDGDCLLASVLLRPPADAAPLLSIAGALAASDAVRALTGLACAFKWPNDVLLNGRKVCGVLTEVRADTDGSVTAVLGVGLNVNLDPAKHPEIAEGASSLASEMGIGFAVVDAEQAFLAGLRERYGQCLDNPRATVEDWSARLSTLGKEVTVRREDGAVQGVAEGVDEAGRLLVRLASGNVRALADGEIASS
ncbi:MAG: biotin--[acetyl-CoA-carboxylase] ligase [Chloroflexota bacterium]|nr:biotin--[acetyl-CoA-carboxylase] ligase [Chloroflexota bacterium]MDE2883524.1 biotin--[acetyl-CoA-carboxylase] ligase [Chloroflexota bacterium]